MKRFRLFYISVIALLGIWCATPAQATGLLYGKGYAFTLISPDNWNMLTKGDIPNGLQAIFHPVGQVWTDSPAVIFVRVERKPSSVTSQAALLLQQLQIDYPDIASKELTPIATADGRWSKVYEFTGKSWGRWQRIGFIPERGYFTLVTLSASTLEAYRQSLTAFRQLIGSYESISLN